MTRKEYIDALAVLYDIKFAIFDIYFAEEDDDRVMLIRQHLIDIEKKIREIDAQYKKDRIEKIIRISGLTYGEFSDKYGISREALIGEEVLNESTIDSLEKTVCEDKAKAHLTWAVFDSDGNGDDIIHAKSRKEALAEDDC